MRGDDGLCIECDDDETGEMISRIVVNPMKPGQRFDGYADRTATEKKILRDVFVAGDMWFRTGDLMRRDRRGYFYFVDRIGDTFRWKGENVSTSEVAEALSLCAGVDEANVYGVEVAHAEGRAGMAALAINDDFTLDGVSRPSARDPQQPCPAAFRSASSSSIDMTSTFKQRKLDLVREGFDPSQTSDPIYFDDPASRTTGAGRRALHRQYPLRRHSILVQSRTYSSRVNLYVRVNYS